MAKLASGLRVNRAADDAAGMAVASGLTTQAVVLQRSRSNISDGVSALQIADGAISNITQMSTRVQELTVQAANGTLSDSQRASIQQEVNALTEEMNRTVQTTEFNGQKLLTGESISIQIGSDAVELATATPNGSVANAVSALGAVDVSTQTAAQAAIGRVEQFASNVLGSQGVIGSSLNRLTPASETLAVQRENVVAAESRIMDADIAQEASESINARIKQQVTVAVMAQANQTPALALRLLA
jgi:flagellin